jgi:hypothetical protein
MSIEFSFVDAEALTRALVETRLRHVVNPPTYEQYMQNELSRVYSYHLARTFEELFSRKGE